MDIISVISSVSKISLVAFIGISVFLGYEIYLFRKESSKKDKPIIPAFNASATTSIDGAKIIPEKKKVSLNRADNRLLVLLIILFIIFGVIAFVGLLDIKKNESQKTLLQPQIVFVQSKGIHLYSENFTRLTASQEAQLGGGSTIIIGVETIPEVEVDRARIRVNSSTWGDTAITVNFDQKERVYYRKYTLSTSESKLKIEAQLHSPVDGWLGD